MVRLTRAIILLFPTAMKPCARRFLTICISMLYCVPACLAQRAETISPVRVTKCFRARSTIDRQLCRATMSKFDREDYETYKEFELSSREVDLNGDRRAEVIAWISSWGGTSGQSLYILSKQRGGYRKIWTGDSTWTPIILLRSRNHHWRDFAFQQGGGGVEWSFITMTYNGRKYLVAKTTMTQPTGEIVIGKGWKHSTFGPIAN